ncbi:MAG: hypothetical protein ACFFD5_02015 [Candidatus Thorarchaeota archaeon]
MELKNYVGIIRSKLDRIGTRSEGPEYYIELEHPNELGQKELHIRKEVNLWENDPVLHKYIGKKVSLIGESIYVKHVAYEGASKFEGIIYKEIKDLEEG